jgi:hypothetical protein
MIDRVTAATGRLGPVCNSAAMAKNILAVLGGDREAMSAAARANALSFSWERSMEILFGDFYPRALARAQARALGESVQGGLTPAVEAD